LIVAAIGLRSVVNKVSVIEGPVLEDEGPFALCLAVQKVPNVDRSVLFVHFAKAVWFIVVVKRSIINIITIPSGLSVGVVDLLLIEV
jgi:hypothetical protein